MKILVDAMCAEFGGIRTYVERLLEHWHDTFPDDELHVLVPQSASLPTGKHIRHEVPVKRPRMVGRPWAQTALMRRLANRLDVDVVLATAPTTTVRHPGRATAVVILDLRHELRPEQFSWARRLLRDISYGRSYRLADGFIAISKRSLDDLHDLHPATRVKPSKVAYLGADHVQSWPAPTRTGPAITFAHHSNKNPDLIIDGWSALVASGRAVPQLLVLGVGSARDRLMAMVESCGLGDHVTLAPFLPDDEFAQVMTEAEMVVFPSDFEGFGLPVVEAMQLNKAVVIGPEKATTEIAGGHAYVMTDWTPEALAAAVTAAQAMGVEDRAAAREHGLEFTWERTVKETRALLEGLRTSEAVRRR